MEITVLGSGTYEPDPKRHMAGYLLKASDKNIIFDFGWGAMENMIRAGVNYFDVDAIFLTHLHPDHCSDLLSFIHIAQTEAVTNRMNHDLTIYGPRGMNKTMEQVLLAFNMARRMPKFKLSFKELKDNDTVWIGKAMVRCHGVKHNVPDSLAYRVECEGKSIAYSGDTADCDGLRTACKGADLAIIEASWPEELNTPGHMTSKDAGRIAKECFVRKLVLTHVAPKYLQEYDVIGDASEQYNGPIVLAEDLMKIKV